MTMPHLMNCPHRDDSWCLDCVKAEWERTQAEIEHLRTLLATPPTWLCADCRSQWIMRDEAEKQGPPQDNRDAAPLPPKQDSNGTLKCPGKDCAGILNKRTPERCPNCLQPLEKTK